jgi:hypothetical protein
MTIVIHINEGNISMSMIDRYRKKGGFVQLLNLIETMGKDKQEKFLKMIGDESPNWSVEIRKRLLSIDKILSWNPSYLAEIFPHIPGLQLAMIVGGLPPDKAEVFMKVLTFKEKKTVEETLSTKKPTPAETSTGIMKLFAEIRKMEAEGTLRFDKFDPEMVIPDNLEEQLAKGATGSTAATGNVGLSAETEKLIQNAHSSGGGIPPQLIEEVNMLKKKMVQLSQENQKLATDNKEMRDRLDQIKKIA